MAEHYPSNSDKMREARLIRDTPTVEQSPAPENREPVEPSKPKAKPEGIVRTREVSTFKKVFAALFPEGFKGVKEHIIWDIFVPRMQKLLHEGWDDVGDALFQSGPTARQSAPHVSYDSSYRRNTQPVRVPTLPMYDYQEVVWDTKAQAEKFLRVLKALLNEYHVVTLLDYNSEVGNETYPSQSDYGWIRLDTARVERTYNGWVVVLPRPIPIETR